MPNPPRFTNRPPRMTRAAARQAGMTPGPKPGTPPRAPDVADEEQEEEEAERGQEEALKKSARLTSSGGMLSVLPLDIPAEEQPTKRGRKAKLSQPPLPQGILDGMTELEQEWFSYFLEAYKRDYHITKDSDIIALTMASTEFINLWRAQAMQLSSGQLISARYLHPGIQLRAWLDSLSVTRKARKEGMQTQEDEELERWKQSMRKLSS